MTPTSPTNLHMFSVMLMCMLIKEKIEIEEKKKNKWNLFW